VYDAFRYLSDEERRLLEALDPMRIGGANLPPSAELMLVLRYSYLIR
jgi:hypothetical protein